MPIVRDGLANGVSVEGLALVEALWARMCQGTREDGSEIEPNDPHWNTLNQAALAARERPHAWLEQNQLYGDLKSEPRFVDAFARSLARIWDHGCVHALEAYLADG